MIAGALLLASASALPPVIPDPRRGSSAWVVVHPGAAIPEGAASGYLLPLPGAPQRPDQAWLERAVALASRNAPVVAFGRAVPPKDVLPYVDGYTPERAPAPAEYPGLLARLGGVALVVTVADPSGAVAALTSGATSVLMANPDPEWAHELSGLLPDEQPARAGGVGLATALRSADLATVVGVPRKFAGGEVTLPGTWYGEVTLFAGGPRALAVRRGGKAVDVALPAVPDGGVLVASRPPESGNAFERVEVSGEQLPSAAEVLARHQRAIARQERLVPRWQADERLLVRVWVGDLGRSFEVVLAGPAFWQRGVGTDWAITRAWVDGVAWNPDRLPDLPLLEPQRPPAPPLALRLDPSYRYALAGVERRAGHRCFALTFAQTGTGEPHRHGTAFIDAVTFGLVELDESADDLPGEVRSTRSVTTYRRMEFGGVAVWLPERQVADDLLSVFGGAATVHRQLDLQDVVLDPQGFDGARSAAYASPHRMLRDSAGGVVNLVPDGKAGRVPQGSTPVAQRFLVAGVAYDPGLSYPVPFGGVQIQDFDFRKRGEQLRLLVAGVVNDGAWSARHGTVDLSARAFVQLLPFSSSRFRGGRESKDETVKVLRQRVGVGAAKSVGPVRVLVDLGVDRWDFSRDTRTAADFVLPRSTFESVARLQGEAALGPVTAALTGEAGWRSNWKAWGVGGDETPRRSWQRGRLFVVYEKALFPLAKLHLDGELWAGRNLDRFSAPSPSRFGALRMRGIASDRVLPERLGVVRASLSLPLSPVLRAEAGIDAGWVRDIDHLYRARPISGVGAGVTAPGPWGTLLQARVGFPLATPGPRAPTLELFLLRPLAHR
jgi:hypothetical protein